MVGLRPVSYRLVVICATLAKINPVKNRMLKCRRLQPIFRYSHNSPRAAPKLLPIYREIKTIYIKIVGGLTPENVASIETKHSDALEWDASNRSILVH